MSSPAHRFIEPQDDCAAEALDAFDHAERFLNPYDFDDVVSDEDIDILSDPFEILAKREERAGVPLFHLTVEHDH